MFQTDNSSMQKVVDVLNQMAFDEGVFGKSPSLRYFGGGKKNSYAFAWTTERSNDKKFWALKYRNFKNGDWSLRSKAGFRRRKTAKDRAWNWYQKYLEGKNGRI